MTDHRALCQAGTRRWNWSDVALKADGYLEARQQPRVISEADLKSAIQLVKTTPDQICVTEDNRAKAAMVLGYVAEADSINPKIPATEVKETTMSDYLAFRTLMGTVKDGAWNGTLARFAHDVRVVTSYYFSDHHFDNSPTADQERVLQDVLGQVRDAKKAGRKPVVIFDLDDAIFDPSHREHRLLNEVLAEVVKANPGALSDQEIAKVQAIQPEDLSYNVPLDLQVSFGITNEALLKAWTPYFLNHFFRSDYCREDPPYPGAPEYVREVQKAGATIVYFTGRQEKGGEKDPPGTMDGMRAGTLEALSKNGFPVPNGKNVQLIMKPEFGSDDMAYKDGAVKKITAMGTPIAAFDNEPAADAIYAKAGFPVVVDIGMVQANFYQGKYVNKEGKRVPYQTLQDLPVEPDTVQWVADFRRLGAPATPVMKAPAVKTASGQGKPINVLNSF